MIDWDDVRYFLAVARGGSVRAAADRLGVNHSTVLRRIAQLEERLGAQMFEKLPNLKIITHHLGAMAPYLVNRLGYGMDQFGSRTADEDYGALLKSLKKRPIDYFRMFYADTAEFGSLAATRCGLDFFGVDHVLFASDCPFEPAPGLYVRETLDVMGRLGLSEADLAKIRHGNAMRLMPRLAGRRVT